MEIVIKIHEKDYQSMKNGHISFSVLDAIMNGTSLPKGHGRLMDENELIDEIVCEEIDGRYYDVIYAHSIYDANTIIEADKEVLDENSD